MVWWHHRANNQKTKATAKGRPRREIIETLVLFDTSVALFIEVPKSKKV